MKITSFKYCLIINIIKYINIKYELNLIKRQNNIDNKKWWFDGLTDEEYDVYISYYNKQRREKPGIQEAERDIK